MESKESPLYARFPELTALPRAALGSFPSPIDRIVLRGVGELWVKRDDLDAPVAGGNKVRALEFLLGAVRPGDTVLTAGGEGSTHVYATAVHAARLGAETIAVRWRHDMHPQAEAVGAAAQRACKLVRTHDWPAAAMLQLASWRWRRRGAVRYVPIGGSSPLGILGHVNAALEMADQVARGDAPEPTHVVVPLGSGGTAAGLAVGFAVAGLNTTVIAARVAPRLVVNATRVRLLARRSLAFIERTIGRGLPVRPVRIVVDHTVYGGAYGRPLAAGAHTAALFGAAYDSEDPFAGATKRASGRTPLVLDATYAAKAAAAAVALAERRPRATRVLFWATFDGRRVTPRQELVAAPIAARA